MSPLLTSPREAVICTGISLQEIVSENNHSSFEIADCQVWNHAVWPKLHIARVNRCPAKAPPTRDMDAKVTLVRKQ